MEGIKTCRTTKKEEGGDPTIGSLQVHFANDDVKHSKDEPHQNGHAIKNEPGQPV